MNLETLNWGLNAANVLGAGATFVLAIGMFVLWKHYQQVMEVKDDLLSTKDEKIYECMEYERQQDKAAIEAFSEFTKGLEAHNANATAMYQDLRRELHSIKDQLNVQQRNS